MATAEGTLADGVRLLLAERGSDPGPVSVTPIPGGASRDTWLAEAGETRWVVRRKPKGADSLVPIGDEYRLLELARDAGVPVPELLAFEPSGGRLGSAAMLMAHVDGTSVAPRILRRPEFATARERLPRQLAEALARVHSVSAGDRDWILPPAPPDPALGQVEEWERQLDEIGAPLPAVELGLRWLRANAPEPADPVLVHGDFRLGNFIVDESGLAAVIDWELAHRGDPAEDIGWLCIRSWRFGNDDQPVAGLGPIDEFLTAYADAGGTPPDADRLRYWEVFGNVKWAIICARQARDHLNGVRRSHELASLGRRICEPEWDLLELIRS